MAKEYIEREAAIEAIMSDPPDAHYPSWYIDRIKTLSAADVVPVVRCKDCRWRGREECGMFYRCECGEQHTWETDDDFCGYGEKL